MKLSSIYDEYLKIIQNMTDDEWNDITTGAEKHTIDDWENESGFQNNNITTETTYQEVDRVPAVLYKVNSYLYQSIVYQSNELFPIINLEGDAA